MINIRKIKNRMLLGNIINILYFALSALLLIAETGVYSWLSGTPRHLTLSGKTYQADDPTAGYIMLADMFGDLVTGVGSILFYVLCILTIVIFLIFLVIFIVTIVNMRKLRKLEAGSIEWKRIVKKDAIFKCIESGALLALGLYCSISSEMIVYFCFVMLQLAVLVPAILNIRECGSE